tara:strand:+ start:2127 stop:2588 length:462 start_codon:yes stop_codon:yes gene_type:complete
MKIFLKLIILFFFCINNAEADLIKPNINLKPLEVLEIQLNSLKNNNIPYEDAGIEQTWEFAHPSNKASTGPFDRFKKMIYSQSYEILIGHENNKIITLSESINKIVYKVYVLSKDKKKYYYIWQIEKVGKKGKLEDCWMTTGVSDPTYLGDII